MENSDESKQNFTYYNNRPAFKLFHTAHPCIYIKTAIGIKQLFTWLYIFRVLIIIISLRSKSKKLSGIKFCTKSMLAFFCLLPAQTLKLNPFLNSAGHCLVAAD